MAYHIQNDNDMNESDAFLPREHVILHLAPEPDDYTGFGLRDAVFMLVVFLVTVALGSVFATLFQNLLGFLFVFVCAVIGGTLLAIPLVKLWITRQ